MRSPTSIILYLVIAGLFTFVSGCDSSSSEALVEPEEPAISWVEVSLPSKTRSVRGLTATEFGDIYGVFYHENAEIPDPSVHRLLGSSWEWVPPPEGMSTLTLSYASGGFGHKWVSEGTISSCAGCPEPAGNHLLRSSGGGPPLPISSVPSYSSGGLQGFTSNGNGTLLFVDGRGKLHRSINGGGTWTTTTSIQDRFPAGPVVFGNAETAFVNVTDNYGAAYSNWRLLRSPNAGQGWASSLPETGWFYTVRRGPAGELLAFSRTLLYASSDVGETWISVALPTGGGDVVAATTTPAGGILLVLQHEASGPPEQPFLNAVFHSPDGGNTWYSAEEGLPIFGPAAFGKRVASPWEGGYDEVMVRDANGYYYLLLHDYHTNGGSTPILLRTLDPVP